jgi:hypothetical protein
MADQQRPVEGAANRPALGDDIEQVNFHEIEHLPAFKAML